MTTEIILWAESKEGHYVICPIKIESLTWIPLNPNGIVQNNELPRRLRRVEINNENGMFWQATPMSLEEAPNLDEMPSTGHLNPDPPSAYSIARKEKHTAIKQAIKDLELRPAVLSDHIMSIIAWAALNAME